MSGLFEEYWKLAAMEVHQTAKEKGWWDVDTDETIVVKFALIADEVFEAIRELRVGDRVKASKELADVIIRIMDVDQRYGLGVAEHIKPIMAANKNRAYRHGKKF